MKKFKFGLYCSLLLFCFALLSATAFALSIQPVRYEFDIEPGKHYDIDYTVGKGEELAEGLIYVGEITGTKLDENGKKSILEGEAMQNEPSYSVSGWANDSKFYGEKTEDGYILTVSFDVPEDTTAGTYYFYTIIHTENPNEDEGTFNVQARVASPVILTIPGEEAEEDLILNSFKLNSGEEEFGFVASFTNNSPVQLLPVGKITIFNEAGEQVEDISTITKMLPDGSKAIESVKSDINFNQRGQKVAPNITLDIAEGWEYRTIEPGKYTAKLEGTFGRSGSFLSETDFEISEDFEILEFSTDFIQTGLPAYFNIKLKNNGDLPVSAKVNLDVKGLFGDTVYKQSASTEAVQAGETLEVSSLEWASGFAFGYYTANLEIIDSSGKIILANTGFFVANVWGILITLLVLIVVIFFIIKYRKLKAKLQDTREVKEKEQLKTDN